MGTRFGVYLPEELDRELEELMKVLGIDSRSRLVQEALRLFLAEHRWRMGGYVVGIVGVLYNHDVGDIDAELTDIQHRYLDIVVSSMHVHLARDKCLLAIVVRGDASRVRNLVNELQALKGVKMCRTLLFA